MSRVDELLELSAAADELATQARADLRWACGASAALTAEWERAFSAHLDTAGPLYRRAEQVDAVAGELLEYLTHCSGGAIELLGRAVRRLAALEAAPDSDPGLCRP